MHRQLLEIQKFNIKNPCKGDRKKLMKKSFTDDHESDDDEYNQCTKKRKTELKINKRSKMKAGALIQQNMLPNLKKQTSYIKNWCTSSDEDETLISSDDENYKPSNKKEETKTFNMNGAQQQQESLIANSVLKKITKIEIVADRVIQKLQSIENLTQNVRIVRSNDLVQQLEKDNEKINDKEVKINTHVKINIASPTKSSQIVNDMACKVETDVKVNMASSAENPQSANNACVDKNMISLGRGVNIPENIMRKIRTSDIGKMTCDLMGHLFSTQEIACSSRTGKKNNIKSIESSREEKNQDLDQDHKFNAIKDYVLLKFENLNNAEQLFNTAVTNKCKNVVRNFKKVSTSEKA
ncbi:uncharacterized protein [Polyergus mexicanus]|uniref:uncharacterized protein n=1 Tax=Polyergus mexicanus TaxID=615972 RepID=UPI0038B5CDE1